MQYLRDFTAKSSLLETHVKRREPTPMNDRYNVMPKYRGFKPGIRKTGDAPLVPDHGPCFVLFSKDDRKNGNAYCAECKRKIDDTGKCRTCGKQYSAI